MRAPGAPSRRTVLRGAGGIAITLPLLEALEPQTARAATEARRLFLFHYPNGLNMGKWFPNGGALIPVNTPTPLGPNPSELLGVFGRAGLLGDMTVITGLSNQELYQSNSHAQEMAAFFSGVKGATGNTEFAIASGGITVDQLVANNIDTTGRKLRSLYVAGTDSMDGASFKGPGRANKNQPYQSARILFSTLFSDLTSPAVTTMIRNRRQSLLDYVKVSLDRVRARCSTCDLTKLDQHLTSIRDIERRLGTTVVSTSCGIGPSWATDVTTVPNRKFGAYSGSYPAADLGKWARLMLDMMTTALQCGLTRVALFSLTNSSENDMQFNGYTDHTISHWAAKSGGSSLGVTPETSQRYTDSSVFKLELMAQALTLMKQKKMGDGRSLLDHTVFVGGSELSDGGVHASHALPMVAAGAGLRGGQHIYLGCKLVFPGASAQMGDPPLCGRTGSNTPLSNLWLTVIRAMGVGADAVPSFGNSSGTLGGLWS